MKVWIALRSLLRERVMRVVKIGIVDQQPLVRDWRFVKCILDLNLTEKSVSKRGSVKSNSKKGSVVGFGAVNPKLGNQGPVEENKSHKTSSIKGEEDEDKKSEIKENVKDLDKSVEV